MVKRKLIPAMVLGILLVLPVSVLAAKNSGKQKEKSDVASYKVDTGEVSISTIIENEENRTSVETKAEPFDTGVVPEYSFGIDEITKEQLRKMGLLTQEGEFDFQALAKLPTIDEELTQSTKINKAQKSLSGTDAFGVVSFEPRTGKVSIPFRKEGAAEISESRSEPFVPKAMPKTDFGIDQAAKEDLAKMGLLREDGKFDMDAFSRLPVLDSSVESTMPSSVNETDDRTPVTNTTSLPWRWNCYLSATFPNGKTYRGTAFLTGPKAAGTCGHALYGSQKGGWATNVVIIAAKDGSAEPYGVVSATNIHVGADWYASEKIDDDWGMVELSSELGSSIGYYGMAVKGSSQVGKNATITGYPKEVQGMTDNTRMWTHTGNVTKYSNKIYEYTIDATGGNSGSAICDGRYVIGVHGSGGYPTNSGRALDLSMYEFYMQYR